MGSLHVTHVYVKRLHTLKMESDAKHQDQGVRHSWPQSVPARWSSDPYYSQPFLYWPGQTFLSNLLITSGMELNSPILLVSKSATESPLLPYSSLEANDTDESRTRDKQVRFQWALFESVCVCACVSVCKCMCDACSGTYISGYSLVVLLYFTCLACPCR